jgi:hypothetical protein
MINRAKGILEVIEYLDPTGQEIVHRVPERGSGEIVLGSQCIVRENQVAALVWIAALFVAAAWQTLGRGWLAGLLGGLLALGVYALPVALCIR